MLTNGRLLRGGRILLVIAAIMMVLGGTLTTLNVQAWAAPETESDLETTDIDTENAENTEILVSEEKTDAVGSLEEPISDDSNENDEALEANEAEDSVAAETYVYATDGTTPMDQYMAQAKPGSRVLVPWIVYEKQTGDTKYYRGVSKSSTLSLNSNRNWLTGFSVTGSSIPESGLSDLHSSPDVRWLNVPVAAPRESAAIYNSPIFDVETGACLFSPMNQVSSVDHQNDLAASLNYNECVNPRGNTMIYATVNRWASYDWGTVPSVTAGKFRDGYRPGKYVYNYFHLSMHGTAATIGYTNATYIVGTIPTELTSVTPTITEAYVNGVGGTGVTGSSIKLYGPTNAVTPVCETTVDVSGKWSCSISPKLTANDTVYAIQKEAGKIDSTPSTRTVTWRGASSAPNVDVATTHSISGSNDSANTASITVKDDDGNVICSVAEVAPNSPWSCDLSDSPRSVGDQLSVIQKEPGYSPTSVDVTVETRSSESPSVGSVVTTGISGTGIAESTINVTLPQGVVCADAPVIVDENGNWTCTFVNEAGQAVEVDPGSTISVTQTQTDMEPSDAVTATIADRSAAPGEVVVDGGTVSGTGEDGSEIVVVGPGGSCSTTVVDGKWQCELPSGTIPDNGGNLEITQQKPGESVSGPPVTVYVPGKSSQDHSLVTVSPSSAVADGSKNTTVTVTVRDANEKPIPNANVVVEFPAGSGITADQAQPIKTDSDGTAQLKIGTTKAGIYPLTTTVTLRGETTGTALLSQPSATFTAGKFVAATSQFMVAGDQAVIANGEDTHLVYAWLKDANGNPISGADVANFSLNLPAGVTQVGDFTSVIGAAGQYQVRIASTSAGEKQISVAYNSGDGAQTLTKLTRDTALFEAGSPSVGMEGKSSVSVTSNQVIADGSSVHTVTVLVEDAQGNPISGQLVDITPATELDLVTATDFKTGADGKLTLKYATTTAGTYQVGAAVNGAVIKGSPVELTYIAGEYASTNTTFTVTNNNAVANGLAENLVTISVVDKDGNPTALPTGIDPVLATDSDDVVFTLKSASEDDGEYVYAATSTVAGNKTVTVNIDGAEIVSVGGATMSFRAGAADLQADGQSILAADTVSAVANGSTGLKAWVYVKDSEGNPIKDAWVNFTTDSEMTAANILPQLTDSNGYASMSYTSTKAGTFDVRANVGGKQILNGDPAQLTFTSDEFSAATSTYLVSQLPGIVANGLDQQFVTVTLLDANKNPVDPANVNDVVSATAPQGVSVGQFQQVEKEGVAVAGQYQATITSTVAGSHKIDVAFAGSGLNGVVGETKATFVAGAPNGGTGQNSSYLSGQTDSVTADGTSTRSVTATVLDANGNPVNGVAVTFIPQTGLNVDSVSSTTGADGKATAKFTSTKAGEYTVEARFTYGNDTVNIEKNSPVKLSFTAGAFYQDTSEYSVSGSQQEVVVGQHTVTVMLKDQFGNLVKGGNAAKIVATADPSAGVTIGDFVEGQQGVFTAEITSTKAGEKKISVSYAADNAVVDVPLNGNGVAKFVAGSPSVGVDGTSVLSVQDGPAIADGASTLKTSVTVTDGQGNPVSGTVVDFVADSGLVSKSDQLTTDTNGVAWVQWATTVAGNYQVAANIGGESIKGSPVSLQFVAGDFAKGNTTFAVSTGDKVANGTDAQQVIIHVKDKDANDTELPDVDKVNITVDSANGVTVGELSYQGNGIYTADIKSTVAGSKTVSVKIDESAIVSTNGYTINFVAGGADTGVEGQTVLSSDSTPAVANGDSSRAAWVVAKDKDGNPIQGAEVVFAASNDLLAQGDLTTTTDAAGYAAVSFNTTVAGSYPITAKVNGAEVANGSPATLVFVPAGFDTKYSSYQVSIGDKVADGQESHVVTVVLKDVNGNLITLKNDELSRLDARVGNAKVSVSDFVPSTNAGGDKIEGEYQANVTSTVAGTFQINVFYDDAGLNADKGLSTAKFVAGAPIGGDSANSSYLSAQTGAAVANGEDTRWVSATVRDSNGNPVPNVEVTFAPEQQLTASSLMAVTDNSGVAKINLTSKASGSFSVAASFGFDGKTVAVEKNSPAIVTFKPGGVVTDPASDNAAHLEATDTVAKANGEETLSVTAVLTDANGNAVVDEKVRFAASPDLETTPVEGRTDENGTYSLTASTTKAGSYPITAQFFDTEQGIWFNIEKDSPVTFVFEADAPSVGEQGTSLISTGIDSVEANGIDTHTVVISIKDAFGNGVVGQKVDVEAETGLTLVDNSDFMTDSAGEVVLQYSATQAKDFTVSAKLNGQTIKGSPLTLAYHSGQFSVDGSSYKVTKGEKTANGADTHTVTVSVADSAGNLISSANIDEVKVSSTSADVTFGPLTAVAGSAGEFTATISSKVAGIKQIAATYEGSELSASGNSAAIFVAGQPSVGDEGSSTITAQEGTAVANGQSTRWVKVLVLDADNNPVSGQEVTFEAPGALVVDSASPITTGIDGVATVNYSSLTSGDFLVSATVGGKAIGGNATISFVADEVSSARSTYSVSTGIVVANGQEAHTVTVSARDAQGNLTDNIDWLKLVATSDPDDVQFGNGFAKEAVGVYKTTITSKVAGNKTISVNLDSQELSAEGNSVAQFKAGKPVVDGSEESKSKIWAQTEPTIADGVSTRDVSVLVTDANGNPVADQTVSFEGSAGLVGLSNTVVTGVDGIATASFVTTTVGTYQVSAKVDDKTVSGSPVELTYRAGKPSVATSSFAVSDGNRIANGQDSHLVTVTLRDKNANVVSAADFDLADLELQVLPNSGLNVGTFKETGTPGVYQAKVQSTSAGTKIASVTYQQVEVTSDGTNKLNFVAGSPDMKKATLVTETGTAAADGEETLEAQVTLIDANNNPVVGQTVSFQALNANGKVFVKSGSTVKTDKYGQATVNFVSVLAGKFEVRALVGETLIGDASNTIEFTAGKLDVSHSSYSVSTGEREANGTAAHIITVRLTDANNNLVSNAKPSNLVASVSDEAGVEISDFSLASQGVYTASITSTISGTKEVQVTYGGKPVSAAGNVEAIFKSGNADLSKATIVGQTGKAVADGETSRWVKVQIVDKNNNPVVGTPVAFFGATDLQSDKANPVLTDSNGEAQVYYTSYKSGIFPITAKVNGTSVAGGDSVSLEFVGAEVSEKTSVFTVTSGDKEANGTESHTITVLARDTNGNPTTLDSAKLEGIIDFGLQASISGFSATSVVGTYTADITSTKAGISTLHVNLNGKELIASGNTEAVFVAGNADLSANGKSKVWGQTDPAIADGAATRSVSALVADINGNPVEGKKVTFEGTEGLVALGKSAITDANGVATVRFVTTTAGTYDVRAQVDGNEILNGSPVALTFTSGDFSAAVSSYTVSEGTRVANGLDQHTITVVVRDANANLVSLNQSQLEKLTAKTSNGETAIGEFVTTKTPGVYQANISALNAGSYLVSVSYDGNTIGATGNKTAIFIAGEVDLDKDGTSSLTAQNDQVRANGVDTLWVRATLKDANGNAVSGQTVSFKSDATDLKGNQQAITDSNGVAQVLFSTTKAGTYTVNAYVAEKQIVNGAPAQLTFISDVPLMQDIKVEVTGTKQVGKTVTAKVSGAESGSTYTYQWMIDGKPVSGASAKTWKLPVFAGGHQISVAITVDTPGYFDNGQATSKKYGPVDPMMTRLAGDTRYGTSKAVASRYAATGGALFVATGTLYPDALTAGAAAANVNGTLVLTSGTDLSQSVRDIIAQKKPSKIYVVGGTAAVSSKVETQLRQASSVSVKRIGGATRYETSEMILKQFFTDTDVAYVATGRDYPDALTASRAAAHIGAPVVLVDGKSATGLSAGVRSAFSATGVKEIRVAGGPAAVNTTFVTNLSKSWETNRVSGTTRYETAVKVNQVFDSSQVDTVWIATGLDFPDALSAAGAGGVSVDQPLYLSYSNCVPPSVLNAVNSYAYGERIVVGGTAAISNGVANLTNTCK